MTDQKINDGGPAFPVSEIFAPDGSHERWAEDGMSLRDYFAAKAMQAAMSRALPINGGEMAQLSKDCYHMADAMLKARQS